MSFKSLYTAKDNNDELKSRISEATNTSTDKIVKSVYLNPWGSEETVDEALGKTKENSPTYTTTKGCRKTAPAAPARPGTPSPRASSTKPPRCAAQVRTGKASSSWWPSPIWKTRT